METPSGISRILSLDPATRLGYAFSDARSGSVLLWREPTKGRPGKEPTYSKGKPGREAVYYKAGPKKGEIRTPERPAEPPKLRSEGRPAEPAIDDGPKDTRLVRLRAWLDTHAKGWLGLNGVLLIEGLGKGWFHGRSADANRVACELRAVIKLWCLDNVVRLEEVEPKDVKLFMTGKSQANKEEMRRAACARLGYKGEDEDEIDALSVLAWGCRYLLGTA